MSTDWHPLSRKGFLFKQSEGGLIMNIKQLSSAILIVLIFFLAMSLISCAGRSAGVADSSSVQITADTNVPTATGADDEREDNLTNVANGTVIDITKTHTVYELPFYYEKKYIYGKMFVPNDGQDKYNTMILAHGFGGTYAVVEHHAIDLVNAGIACYIFDFAGGGLKTKSSGTMMDMSVITEVNDLNAVIDFVQTIDCVDADNLFLLGMSQGGLVAALTSAERVDEIRGLVLLYPGFNIPDMVREMYPELDDIPEQGSLPIVPSISISRLYFKDALGINLYDDIRGYDKDVLLIHGDNDDFVPISYSIEAERAYDSAELIVMPDGGHGFYDSEAQLVAEKIIEYIDQHNMGKESAKS
jgi:pimeloyl-ACP methyl ester carboxylesterase